MGFPIGYFCSIRSNLLASAQICHLFENELMSTLKSRSKHLMENETFSIKNIRVIARLAVLARGLKIRRYIM